MLQSGTTESSLRKIYEEGYLTCSTAVYYEGQGDEREALRCWKTAIQQIRQQYANGHFPEYAAMEEPEKALSDSLRELEYQAQERIDLLEALKTSRQDDPFQDPPAPIPNAHRTSYVGSYGGGYAASYGSGSNAYGQAPSSTPSAPNAGYIGGGTIPAITYGELSRPDVSRIVPPLPSKYTHTHSRSSSYETGAATAETTSGVTKSNSGNGGGSSGGRGGGSGRGRGSGRHGRNGSGPSLDTYTAAEAGAEAESSRSSRNTLSKRTSRSPNKDKQHTLRPTLRTAPGEAPPKPSRSSRSSRSSASTSKPTVERQGASKAATLAWSALGFSSFGKSDAASRKPKSSAAEPPAPKNQSMPSLPVHPRKPSREVSPSSAPALQWDSNSRRLVPQRPVPDLLNISPSHSSADLASTPGESRRSGDDLGSAKLQSLSLNAAASALGRSMQTPSDASRPSRSSRSASHQRPSAVKAGSSSSIDRLGDTTRPKSTGHQRYAGSPSTPSHSSMGSRVEIRRNVHSSFSSVGAAAPPAYTPSLERKPVARKPAPRRERAPVQETPHILADGQLDPSWSEDSDKLDENDKTDKDSEEDLAQMPWKKRKQVILKHLPPGVDDEAAKQILNEIVVQGDVVHWSDIAGLEPAKKALREVVVYPFLRPDLFMGLREPATGMLLFGPPGTGKTMLARAVATESRSTFFSISASSLTSKYLGESEKLVRALFALAKVLAPSIIFVDEIDSILSQRSGSGEHEATRRIKTEFLIQWSDLQRAAAGREDTDDSDKDSHSRKGDASRVLVLAATNLPWAIDEAARRRFVRRQYIPLPETETRAVHLRTLLGQQKHSLTEGDIQQLVALTNGFSGSDITALAKDAAMGPLRSLGDALLLTKMDEIRPIELSDFVSSLVTIRPSVSKSGLQEYEDWARQYGERGG